MRKEKREMENVPKNPAILLLKLSDSRTPPRPIEIEITRGIPLIIIRAQAPFAHNSRPIPTPIIITRRIQIPTLRILLTIRPFQIAMVVVSHEVEVGQSLIWVATSPFLIHDLDV